MKKHLYNYSIFNILFFSTLLVYKQLLFTGTFLHHPVRLSLFIGIALILTVWTIFLSKQKQFFSLVIINLLISALIAADALYLRYFSTAISVTVLYQTGATNSVLDSILSLTRLSDLWYFADFLILIPIWYKVFYARNHFGYYLPLRTKFLTFVVLIVFSGTMVFYNTQRLEKINPGIFTYVWDNNIIINNLGVLFYHAFDVKQFVVNNYLNRDNLSEEDRKEIDQFFSTKDKVADNQFFGEARGKNLIIIQVEALQTFVINKRIENQEVTPNLNNLIKDSLYFPNYYEQVHNGNTSDAEFLTNASLYPLKEGAVFFRYPANKYNSLPLILKDRGYFSLSAHGFEGNFWNRKVMHRNLGFNKFLSAENYVLDETIGWGISDKSFLRQTLDHLDKAPRPFYSFLVTLSSHHPFNMFEGMDLLKTGEFKGTQVGNYLNATRYADEALGEFFKGLKAKGLYEDSIIVIYGDHTGIRSDQHDELDSFLKQPSSNLNRAQYKKVPLIIHIPGSGIKGTKDMVGGQVDLLPTLLNLFGIESDYHMGKDLLSAKENFVVFRDGSFTDGKVFYLNNTDEYYDLKTTQQLTRNQSFFDQLSRVRRLLKISDQTISNDLLKELD